MMMRLGEYRIPQVSLLRVDDLIGLMPSHDLKLVVYRDIGDFDHGLVNCLACNADALGGRILAQVDSYQRHYRQSPISLAGRDGLRLAGAGLATPLLSAVSTAAAAHQSASATQSSFGRKSMSSFIKVGFLLGEANG